MEKTDRIEQNNIVDEVQSSFLEYSMSVIVARALPDLRDGLKPVHRRILYSMYNSGYTPDKQYRKCARIVGDVMGKYHPHGDSSIYEAMVRMAQDFSYRYMLVDGHGNFGNMDGDGAAAMRYTESKLAKISLELIRDIGKDTVNFVPNFDETEKEPEVLPSRFPNILVNGTMGIAVGMATNIPPHNLGEVIDGCVAYIDNKDITVSEMMEYIKGPDFPTGATILGNSGIKKAYETGRGSITIRAKAEIEESNTKSKIIITEIPYGVNTSDLKQKIAELVRDKVIEGIADYHEETNLENGLKIVVTLKKEANANVVLNNLYKHTSLQSTFGIIFLMLDQGQPKTLNLKEIISKYIDYQKEIIIRRTKFELDKAEKRVHILEGLKIALDNIDAVIKIIKESESDEVAKTKLKERFNLDEVQSDAILEMKLRRLTGLERNKIESELEDLLKAIANYKAILASEEKVLEIIKNELLEIKQRFADERRTKIDMTAIDYIEDESLIPVEDVVITITNKGYIKRMTSETYKTQNRGGVGVKGMSTNEEDFVENIISMTTHDYIMFFTNKGKVYRIKGYEIPSFNRQSKGIPVINLLPIEKDEIVKAMLKVGNNEHNGNIVFCTQNGLVKRTDIKEFENIRSNGKIAITLKDEDELLSVQKTNGDNEILIASSNGRMIRFNENEIRIMGRSAAGVRGIDVGDGIAVGCEIAEPGEEILVVTEKGYGKKTKLEEYRMTHRGSKGVKALNITEKNGNIVAFKTIHNEEDVMIVTNSGIIIRMSSLQISTTGRVAQGVKLINLKGDQKVSTVETIEKEEIEENIQNEDLSTNEATKENNTEE
ncbi:MAG: DNA gyrase subunit A [Tenericutes bacterium]|nr:DNA gyrase subunit A [Mycoplasmatota bacterium]